MKWIITLALGTMVLCLGLLAEGRHPRPAKWAAANKNSSQSFAVVELFTSEGCSSCPPADKLLGELASTALDNNMPVFALAFHVDYWDYIGWKDPYANRTYSNRQQTYATAFNSNRVYTPQMIVNGKKEFVGSNRAKARESIDEALKHKAAVEFRLNRLASPASNAVNIRYELSRLPKNAVLNLALVERGLVQTVRRGENSGRTLQHENVVRTFAVLRLTKLSGDVKINIPANVRVENCSVFGYVQNRITMEILGASGLEL